MNENRFKLVKSEGFAKGLFVIVDKETGVNYLVAKFGVAGGLCPLIDQDGKPMSTRAYIKQSAIDGMAKSTGKKQPRTPQR